MRINYYLVFIFSSLSIVSYPVSANNEKLDEIADFADRICNKIPIKGKSRKLHIEGKAKVELPKLLKKLADIGVDGAAAYTNNDYKGVQQHDLAIAIDKGNNCRLEVMKYVNKLLPNKPVNKANISPAKKPNQQKENDQATTTVLPGLINYDAIEASSKFSSSIASKAFDGNINTVWHAKKNDKSRYILLKYRTPKEISKIRFYRNPKLKWYSQIKNVMLIFSDNTRVPVKLQGYNGWEEFTINPPKKTTLLKIQVTKGTEKTNQLKVSEIEIIGK